MKIVAVIPARYGSSRFPGKPLVDICGKPMIWWVYNQAMKVSSIEDVYVATDDNRIYDACVSLGLNVCMTSNECKTGSDRVAEAATKIDGDLFVNIQGDEPVIAPEMIQQVIDIFDDKDVRCGTLKTEITDNKEVNDLSSVKIVTDINNNALYLSRSIIPSNVKDGVLSKVYRHVGVYAYTKDFLQLFHNLPQSELELGEGIEVLRAIENGYKIKVAITEFKSIGVDYPEHIAKVEKFIKSNAFLN